VKLIRYHFSKERITVTIRLGRLTVIFEFPP
jgi:hypothetical protein